MPLLSVILNSIAALPGYFILAALGPPFLDISGYDTNCRIELFRTDPDPKEFGFVMGKRDYVLRFSGSQASIEILDPAKAPSLKIDFRTILAPLARTGLSSLPQESLTFQAKGRAMEGKLFIYNLSGRQESGTLQIEYLKSDLLLKHVGVR